MMMCAIKCAPYLDPSAKLKHTPPTHKNNKIAITWQALLCPKQKVPRLILGKTSDRAM